MALENKRLSEYPELTSPNIDATTNLVVLTGVTKVNKKLPVENFIEDSLTSDSTVKPLSAKQGKALKDEVDSLVKLPTVGNNQFKYPFLADGETITWEYPNDTLTATSIEDGCLSAKQGKVLKDLVDLKAPSLSPQFSGSATARSCSFLSNDTDDEILIVDADGKTISILVIDTFADNTEAAALSAGTIYKTATGQLMIKY